MTASPLAAPTTPLRRLPVPACEPPFDDELPGGAWERVRSARQQPTAAHDAVQGTLALAFVLPSGLPAAPRPAPTLRLVPDPQALPWRRAAAADRDADDFGPQPTCRAELPEPRHWAGRFVQALVEVLAGDRPLPQLVRWTSTEVYEDVAALLPPSNRRAGGAAEADTRAAVRSVHLTEPADGVAEVAATVRRGRRSTAVALRLEGLDGRWQCTALEVG